MQVRSYAPLAGLMALAFVMFGCGPHHVNLDPTTLAPAARGRVVVSHDAEGNTTIDLTVKHLAYPRKLDPPKSTYVVWVEPIGGAPINQGELRVGDNLQGELKFVVASSNFDIFISAEDNARVIMPAGPEVLRATVGH